MSESKREARIEQKKRKIAAFLALAQTVDCCDEPPMKKENTAKSDETTEERVWERGADHWSGLQSQKRNKDWRSLSDVELVELRAQLRRRQKAAMAAPKLYLTLDKLRAPVGHGVDLLPPAPLFMLDVQHLLLFASRGNIKAYSPRWCKLLRWKYVEGIAVLVLNGLDVRHSDQLPALKDHFDMSVEVVSPTLYSSTVISDLCQDRLLTHTDVIPRSMQDTHCPEGDVKVTPFDLLLTPWQMKEEHYPIPMTFTSESDPYPGFVCSKDKYSKVTKNSPVFAVDCEMCLTSSGKHELTRVSVVTQKLEMIYDTLVKPHNRITNYLTRYSGITKKMLSAVTTRLTDVQTHLSHILPPDAILCGHSLNYDLHALQMFHPYVIDTSVVFKTGLTGKKSSLRALTRQYLGKTIQASESGHCSIEDATSTMELLLLRMKRGFNSGDDATDGLCSGQDEVKNSRETDDTRNEISESVRDTDKQPTAFFPRHQSLKDANFLKILKTENKSVSVIGSSEALAAVAEKGWPVVTVSTDKDCVKAFKEATTHSYMVYAELNKGRCVLDHTLDKDTVQARLQKLNKRIEKILNSVVPSTLVTVILAGNMEDEKHHNALCLCKLTPPQH